MSDDWAKLRDQFVMGGVQKGRQAMPEKACGKCEHFRQHSASAAGDGHCAVIVENELNKVVFDNTDASQCSQYKEIDRIRTDTSEFMWDPTFRPQRQIEEK